MSESERPADGAGDDELDEMLGDNPQDAREWFRKEVRTRGLRSAFWALVSVCEDPKAPAPARATAGTALLRAGGAFAAAEEASLDEKPIDQMTAAEMDRALRQVRAKRERLERAARSEDDNGEGGIFE